MIGSTTAARILPALAAIAAAAGLSGCGGGAAIPNEIEGGRLTVYVSVPLRGASAISGEAVLDGARLALADSHGRDGGYRISLRTVDDSNPKTGVWDPGLTTVNAHNATLDRTLIGYIGEYNSGASAVSIPVLSRDEIPQISPSSTAVGLTEGGSEASPGEPEKYYPTGRHTFVRVVPNDVVQAAALAKLMRSFSCTKTYILDDGEVDGRDIAESFQVAAKQAGVGVIASTEFLPHATSYTSLAAGVAQTGADCVLLGAITEDNAVLVARQIAAALPDAMIFGTAGLAESTFVNPAMGGLPTALDPRVLITSPALDPSLYPPAGRRVLARYRQLYGAPQPYSIFGYEAMSLLLDAITRATASGRKEVSRSRVLSALFATRGRPSVLGTYSIEPSGDTTLDRYGVYRVRNGQLEFERAIGG